MSKIGARSVIVGGILVALTPVGTSAQAWDSSSARTVVPGVVHRRLVDNSGPWRLNVLEIDLRTPGITLRAVRANDQIRGRETVRSMAARFTGPGIPVAAVNGDFFNVMQGTGESENNVVIDGKILKGVRVTDSPYDTYDNIHSQFGIDSRNRPHIDRFRLDAQVLERSGRAVRLDGINFRQDSNALVLYTPVWSDSTPVDSATVSMASVRLRIVRQRGDTMFFSVVGAAQEGRSAQLRGDYAIAGSGAAREFVGSIVRRAGNIRVVARLTPRRGRLTAVVGGWPRLVRDGRSSAAYADILEGTFPRFSAGRNPRTAIGFSRDSATIYLLTVDGRRESDAGMSLVELAKAMLRVGAWDAMGFDGGGSTTMVVEGHVVNRPSDRTGERAVGSAILVVSGGAEASGRER